MSTFKVEALSDLERETVIQTFDYKDLHGNHLCAVEMKTGKVIPITIEPELGSYEGRELLSVILVAPNGERLDVLKKFKFEDTLIVDSLVEQCGHIESEDTILVPPLHSPVELEWLLHEPQHHEQERTEGFKDLMDLYNETPESNRLLPYDKIREKILKILDAIPHVKKQLFADIEQLEDWEKNIVTGNPNAEELMVKQEKLREKIKLDNIFFLPRQITERDAERAAVEKLKVIAKETGVDLLKVLFVQQIPELKDTPHLRAVQQDYAEDQSWLDANYRDPGVRGKAYSRIISIKGIILQYLKSIRAIKDEMPWGGDGNYDIEEFLGI